MTRAAFVRDRNRIIVVFVWRLKWSRKCSSCAPVKTRARPDASDSSSPGETTESSFFISAGGSGDTSTPASSDGGAGILGSSSVAIFSGFLLSVHLGSQQNNTESI